MPFRIITTSHIYIVRKYRLRRGLDCIANLSKDLHVDQYPLNTTSSDQGRECF